MKTNKNLMESKMLKQISCTNNLRNFMRKMTSLKNESIPSNNKYLNQKNN